MVVEKFVGGTVRRSSRVCHNGMTGGAVAGDLVFTNLGVEGEV